MQAFPASSPLEAEFREVRSLEEAGKPAAADRYRALLAKGFPLPDAVHWRLGKLLPPEQAEAHWRSVVQSEPESPFLLDALEGLANICEKLGRLPEAEEWLKRLLAAAPDSARKSAALGRLLALYELKGAQEEANRTARTLWVDYASLPAARRLEGYFTRTGLDPFSAWPPEDALKRAGHLLDKGSREEAVRTLTELRRRVPRGSGLDAEAALALGKGYYFLKRYEDALGPLGTAEAEPKCREEARFYFARCLFGLNRGDEGAKDMVALAGDYPDSPKAPLYLQQASRVFRGRGMSEDGRRAEELLQARYPESGEAREIAWSDGWRAYGAKQPAEAAELFRIASERAPRDWFRAQSLYWKGRALKEAGDPEQGKAALETVVREFPLGYYGRLAAGALSGDASLSLSDPRRAEGRSLPQMLPQPEDAQGDAKLARAQAYLRLGLPEAAARVLRSMGGTDVRRARLLYWAEDFRGALSAAGRTWLDWPAADPAPLSREGLAYPIAYPRTVAEAAREAGIHPHLVLAIAHTESHFDPRVYSSAEARGLMQFIPSTGAQVAKGAGLGSFTVDDLYDPSIALRLGARHLRELLDRFGGDVISAVAAYNGGAGAVERWRKEFGRQDPSVFVESIPYGETRKYVKKVLTALDAYGRLDPPGLWKRPAPAPAVSSPGPVGPQAAEPKPTMER